MNTEIKTLHFSQGDDADGIKQFIEKKMRRLHNADNIIVNITISVSKDAQVFVAEANVSFRWSVSVTVKESDHDAHAAVDKMFDKLDAKVTKEKEKAQSKRGTSKNDIQSPEDF
jgi:putative sigma-54 modulation protein